MSFAARIARAQRLVADLTPAALDAYLADQPPDAVYDLGSPCGCALHAYMVSGGVGPCYATYDTLRLEPDDGEFLFEAGDLDTSVPWPAWAVDFQLEHDDARSAREVRALLDTRDRPVPTSGGSL